MYKTRQWTRILTIIIIYSFSPLAFQPHSRLPRTTSSNPACLSSPHTLIPFTSPFSSSTHLPHTAMAPHLVTPSPLYYISKCFTLLFTINNPPFTRNTLTCSLLANMAAFSSFHTTMMLLLFSLVLGSLVINASAGNFYQDVDITWGDGRGRILNGGELLTLSLDKTSGSGFQSKNEYMFGKVDVQMKLIAGNSAGTVTTFYLKSPGNTWDEIDFEFLGNLSGDPYTLHTNVFTQGKGNREQQFHLWFDPTADFHTYSILWNPQRIIFSVDGTPIREFKNQESIGVQFPKNQPMRLYSTLWNADDWATRGGLVKTDWSFAPFTASYRNYNANACVWSSGKSSCGSSSTPTSSGSSWLNQGLDSTSQERMSWVQKKYMIYNYCTDVKRFPQGLPAECTQMS